MKEMKCETCGLVLNLENASEENNWENPNYLHEIQDTKENGYKQHFFCKEHCIEYMTTWKMSRLLEFVYDKVNKLCWEEMDWSIDILGDKIKEIEGK